MPYRTTAAFILILTAVALPAQEHPALPALTPAYREYRIGPSAKQPLWMSLAGRKVQHQRAHVLVELEVQNKATPGLHLLEAAGPRRYLAALDLTTALGVELQSGSAEAMRRANLRGIRLLDEEDKLPASVPRSAFVDGRESIAAFDVYFFADTDLAAARTDLALLGLEAGNISPYFQRLRVELEPPLLKQVAKLDWVHFIEPEAAAKKLHNNRDSAALIQTQALQGADFNLSGNDVTIGIVDGDLPTAHREFSGRVTNADTRRNSASGASHATHVAGTMIAAGEFDPGLKGMAPAAKLRAWHFAGDTAQKMLDGSGEAVAFNNSWGLIIDEERGNCNDYGLYGATERDLDRVVRDKNVSVVFSMGNDRDEPICSLLPQAGYYSNSRPASAKNIITVGAVAGTGPISTFSGAGPSRDGRLKPDVVALGVGIRSTSATTGSRTESGTSMSAPAVTGTIALLAERYKSAKNGERPPADLVKAILLNTAKDLGNPGPDYTYGYGLVQAVDAVKTIDEERYARARVGAGVTAAREFEVTAGAPALRVMLAYSDAPGQPGTASAIVNHLDLELIAPDGAKYQPLGLDPRQPAAAAKARAGIRDTTKQVVVDQPAAGKWTARVTGLEVAGEDQDYALTWNTNANPVPPCSTTVSSALELAGEKPGVLTVHVNAGTHCDAWQVTGAPDWVRVVGGNLQGTGVVKLGVAENAGDRSRNARLTVAGKALTVRQNARCVTPVSIGASIDASLSDADCLVELPTALGPYFAYLRKYEFTGRQGQNVAIRMSAPRNGIDSYLYLVAPGDVILQEDDDSGGGVNARVPSSGYYRLPFSGVYTIWATTALDVETGAYTLSIEEGPAVDGGAVTPRQIAACPAKPTGTLGPASTSAGRRGDLYRTDVYQFFARIGQEITLEVNDAAFDPFVYLLGPAGNTLGTLTNDGAERRRITVTIPRTGTHSLEVTSFAPFVTGAYSLTLEGCSPQ